MAAQHVYPCHPCHALRVPWLQELRQAAEAAVLLTHPSDAVADAAAVLAAAIAWCLR